MRAYIAYIALKAAELNNLGSVTIHPTMKQMLSGTDGTPGTHWWIVEAVKFAWADPRDMEDNTKSGEPPVKVYSC